MRIDLETAFRMASSYPVREIREPDGWLSEQLTRTNAVAVGATNPRLIECLQIPLVSCAASREPIPSLVVDESRLASAGRQPEIGVVDSQEQPMLGARREHSVRLETTLGDQVVHEDSDVGLVTTQFERRALQTPGAPRWHQRQAPAPRLLRIRTFR